jgi:hypothetical protein
MSGRCESVPFGNGLSREAFRSRALDRSNHSLQGQEQEAGQSQKSYRENCDRNASNHFNPSFYFYQLQKF